jgi:hypothetical protein
MNASCAAPPVPSAGGLEELRALVDGLVDRLVDGLADGLLLGLLDGVSPDSE